MGSLLPPTFGLRENAMFYHFSVCVCTRVCGMCVMLCVTLWYVCDVCNVGCDTVCTCGTCMCVMCVMLGVHMRYVCRV